MKRNVAPTLKNLKHHADSSPSHQPANAGDFIADLEKTQKFVLGRSFSRQVERNDKPHPRVRDTSEKAAGGALEKITEPRLRPDINAKNSDRLKLKKSKSVPATKIANIADHPKPRQKKRTQIKEVSKEVPTKSTSSQPFLFQRDPAKIKQNDNVTHKLSSYKLSDGIRPHISDATLNEYIVENFNKHFEARSIGCSKTHASNLKTEVQKTTNEVSSASRKTDMYQRRCREMSPIPGPSTRSDDYYVEFDEPTIESTTQDQEGSGNVRETSRTSTKSQQNIRQLSPIPGPSTRSDDYYCDFPCESVTEDQPDEEEAEEEKEVQDNPDENEPNMIPFDFLNQYLHISDNKLEQAAVHVKYGQIAECTCDLYDIEDPCIKHIATEKLRYFEDVMKIMQAYSDDYVEGPEYVEALDLIHELCPNVYQCFLETPHELTDENYYSRCLVSEQNVVKTVIQILKEEDHLVELLQTELKIGEKRCLFDDNENEEFNLAIAFLIQEYPSVFVQLSLEFEFFELTELKHIVNGNRKKIIFLSKLTREELIEYDEQFSELTQQ